MKVRRCPPPQDQESLEVESFPLELVVILLLSSKDSWDDGTEDVFVALVNTIDHSPTLDLNLIKIILLRAVSIPIPKESQFQLLDCFWPFFWNRFWNRWPKESKNELFFYSQYLLSTVNGIRIHEF